MTGPFTRMEAEILSQRLLLEAGVGDLVSAARAAVDGLPRPARLVLTGCGDSICSAGAVARSLAERAGLPAIAVSPLTILRTEACLQEGDLLVALSVSGRTARVVEAAGSVRKAGRRVLALTCGKDAPITREAERTLVLPYAPGKEILPGTLSFTAGLLTFLAVAEALSPDEGGGEDLAAASRPAAARLLALISRARELAAAVSPDAALHLLALGDLVPIADYGRMKLLECCARDAVVSDPEEWCHGPFFVAGSGSLLTCLIASQDDASFFAPAVAAAARIGAGAIGVVDSAESAARAGLSPDRVVVVEGGGPLTPLLCAVPLQVLAMERARRLGTVPFGFSDAQRRSANHGAIYGRE